MERLDTGARIPARNLLAVALERDFTWQVDHSAPVTRIRAPRRDPHLGRALRRQEALRSVARRVLLDDRVSAAGCSRPLKKLPAAPLFC